MAEFKIGSLRFTWRGVWATSTFYNRDAVVSFNGKTYVCLVPHTSSLFYSDLNYVTQEGENTPYWVIMFEGKTWKTEWTQNTEYSEGNIIVYGGSAYFCAIPHTSGLTFDITKWTTAAQFVNWTTDWLPLTHYYQYDIVKYGGRAYTNLVEHTSSDAVAGLEADIANWELLNDGIEYKGAWDQNGIRYKAKDIVKNGPDLWICNLGHTSTATFDLSKWDIWVPGLDFGASWSASEIYQHGDIVVYGGYSYTSITTNNLNHIPSINSANWELLTVSYSLQSEWSSAIFYKVGSVVRKSGHLFTALQDNLAESPTGHVIETTYTATGSSGTTVKVADTTGITAGMVITSSLLFGKYSFSRGQIVSQVVDETTIITNEAPDNPISDNDSIFFNGINSSIWSLVIQGTTWKNRWVSGQSYTIGDIVVWKNRTYKCVADHLSAITPDIDVLAMQWTVLLQHDRYNVLNIPGDIVTRNSQDNQALPIGQGGYLLKSINGVPTWSDVFVTPNVFYVTPDGVDSPNAGTNWDRPWRSIKYACDYVRKGILFQNAAFLLSENKNYIVEEMYKWMIFNNTNNNPPFGSATYDWDVNNKAQRDADYVIDAIIYDMTRGGNSQSVAVALEYFAKGNKNSFVSAYVLSRIDIFIAALTRLKYLINIVLTNGTIDTSYQTLYTMDNTRTAEANSDTTAAGLIDIIISALQAKTSKDVPVENTGITVTIMIKTGTYKEILPIVVPENTGLAGDELRGVVVQPANVINSVVTFSNANTNLFTVGTTVGMTDGTPVQFVSMNPVSGKNTVFGGVNVGLTYYVIGSTVTPTSFGVSASLGGVQVPLTTFSSYMYVYGGDALSDMFRVRNGSGIRNMTLTGLLGTLTDLNSNLTRRPTGGTFVALDPGDGPNDTSAWIFRKSPYIQNVTNFGIGSVGLKIDGTLHNGGNKSVVCNDFTQIISDGIGIWTTGRDSLCEAVSVFSYYGYAGYFSENGGKIRATNGNSSYGTYGVIAEGYDLSESPITGNVYNRYYQAIASPLSALGLNAGITKLQYDHAGEGYTTNVTNLLKYSNSFNNWSSDSNVSLVQSIVSPVGTSDAWLAIGNTSGTDSSYLYQSITIPASGATYTAVAGTNISGSGVNATFNVTVKSNIYEVAVNAGGSGYVVSNQISIPGSSLGGINGINDLTIVVESLTGSSISTITTAGVVPTGSSQLFNFSMYCKQGNSQTLSAVLIFTGSTTTTSQITFNFATETATGSSPDTGAMPVTSVINLNNGWYRISASFNDTLALNTTLSCRIYPRGLTGNSGYSYIYGAQLEIGVTNNFYQQTENDRYSAFANISVVGSGINAKLVSDELRFSGVFQPRVTTYNGYTGGLDYLHISNNAQSGTSSTLTIAGSDVDTANSYVGMRLFINSGAGVGQYGYITKYNEISKVATVIKDSFDLIVIDSISSNSLILNSTSDVTSMYVNQSVQFIPQQYTTLVSSISQSTLAISSIVGGTTNTFSVSSTALLTVNMAVTFSGTAGGVTTGYTYYILNIIDLTTFQISLTVGGAIVLLSDVSTPTLVLKYPANTSLLSASTTNMDVNLPIEFTGVSYGSVVTGTTYYINEVYDSTTFSVSSALVTVTPSATSVSNIITVDSSIDLVPLTPIKFAGTSTGGITAGTKYYVNKKPTSTQLTLSTGITTTTAISSSSNSKMISVSSSAGMVVGNPIRFTGTSFGGIVNESLYYVSYINDSAHICISATSTIISINPSATTASGSLITVSSTSNFTLLYPVVFTGTVYGGITSGSTYYISTIPSSTQFTISASIISVNVSQTSAGSNLLTVSSTLGFVANHPIIFGGEVFGGIVSTAVYYILAVNNSTSFTVSTAIGGAAVILTDATGVMTARTTSSDFAVTTGSGGSMVMSSVYTGPHVSVTNGSGSMIVRTTVDTLTLTTAGSVPLVGTSTTTKSTLTDGSGSMTATFSAPMLGGISAGTVYYVKTITTGATNSFTISSTLGGTVATLTNGTGAMQMGESGWDNVNSGYPNVNAFDSTTIYSIEPKVTFSAPPFSYTAITHTTQAGGTTYTAVGYGNSKFVAIPSANATISTSVDGTTWSASTLPISASWQDIAYGNRFWVIISSGGSAIPGSKVLFSNSDLITAKTAYLPSIATWKSVTYGNGSFVAIATSSSSAAYSTNFGSTWTAASLPSSTTWTSVTYGKGIFVAVASGGTSAAYSTNNGATWTSSTLTSASAWSTVAFGNGRFVAVSGTASTKPCYSFDGITWYESPYAITADKLAYGNGVFLALNSAGATTGYISDNGYKWTTKAVSNTPTTGVKFGFNAVGAGVFVTASTTTAGLNILAGTSAKGRAFVSASNAISSVKIWEPGSNYSSMPTVTILDPNITVPAYITPRVGNGVLGNPSFINNGTGYLSNSTAITISGNGYADDYQIKSTLVCNLLTRLPSPGDSIAIGTNTKTYKITAASVLDGTVAPFIKAMISISPSLSVETSPAHATAVTIRTKYSQARLTNHDFLNIGYGNYQESNFPYLPVDTDLHPSNEIVESQNGRVFYSSTDQDGNFRVGNLFAVEQATGIVTLSASQFGLEGLAQLKLGGISIGSREVLISQFSTDQTFAANSNSIVPTQKAIRSYLTARLSQGGSNTFTGQLIAGTVSIGGPDKLTSTIPKGTAGSQIKIPVTVNIHGGGGNGLIDGDAMAMAFFIKSFKRNG